MGIIGSIRKHSIWAVVFVGIAILAFILGDLTKNQSGPGDMGRVNGEAMTQQRFNALVSEAEANYRMNYQTAQVPAEAEQQIRDQVWQRFVDETLMGEQMKKLGLTVGSAELNDMYTGKFIHPAVRQSFTDPQTGEFNVAQVNYFINTLDQRDSMTRMQWAEMEKGVREDREAQKYSTLISAGFYMPKAIANKVAELSATTTNARVVALPFSSVKDDEISVSDADIKAYYDEHMNDFKVSRMTNGMADEIRVLRYVGFPVTPTQQDYANIQKDVMKVWDEFQTVEDNDLIFFVNSESDTRYDSTYKRATEFKAPFDEQIAAAKEGDMLAPVVSGDQWMMAKVQKSAMRPDSLRASVVCIFSQNYHQSITRSNDQAKQLADSVLTLVKSGAMTFEQAVEQFSDDSQKASTKGDQGWQLDGSYGIFNEQLVNAATGESFVFALPNDNGYFVIKQTGKTTPVKKYRVALVTRDIVYSEATDDRVRNAANAFAAANRTAAEMDDAARKENLNVRNQMIISSLPNLNNMDNTRNIIQWAFNKDTKVGSVADQVYRSDNMYIVPALVSVSSKGYLTPEQVSGNELDFNVERQVRVEKAGELLMARAEEAVRAGKDINSIATKLGVAVDTLEGVGFNDYYLGRFGMEPKVQSAIATTKSGLVGPIKGANGVYTVNVDGKAQAETNAEAVKTRLEQPYRNKARMVQTVLRNKAKIVDNRISFF